MIVPYYTPLKAHGLGHIPVNLPVPIISPFQSISPLYSHYIPIISFIDSDIYIHLSPRFILMISAWKYPHFTIDISWFQKLCLPWIPTWDQLIREAIALEPETDESRHWAGLGNTGTAAKDSEIYEISGESHVK